ncbi:helix-turn-helix transcriptional regulator [Alteraurantiacibacter buctensis]|uniref:LuxR family transcriptional regulator n=1 Tax=Alteraurantiacibacter buctensis TaxID=1503981 RepID=A0A844YUP4_9SPHN|nr:LuxR C-terminal-related transcriptional regulator [Alteraurantiacibacter buctensis]MXO70750.1 LuxR family transcriptional regulator [Alteraurantiacibacter buctensis]
MLLDCLQEIARSDDPVRLWKGLVRSLRAQGFVAGSYFFVKGAQVSGSLRPLTFGFPRRFIDAYTDTEFDRLDVVPRRTLASGRVMTWTEAWSSAPIAAAEQQFRQQMLARLGAAEDTLDGLAVPGYGPRQSNAFATLVPADQGRAFSAQERRMVQAVVQAGHMRLCEAVLQNPPEVLLSPREREILQWVALGKSNSVIAEMLNCSANTVDTHLRRAFGKLSVSDRTTAAIRAISLGLIA